MAGRLPVRPSRERTVRSIPVAPVAGNGQVATGHGAPGERRVDVGRRETRTQLGMTSAVIAGSSDPSRLSAGSTWGSKGGRVRRACMAETPERGHLVAASRGHSRGRRPPRQPA